MMNLLDSIELRNAWWLWLAVQPLLLSGLAALLRYARRDDFADAHLLPWVRSAQGVRRQGRGWRLGVLLLAWGLLALAMAGPRIAEGVIERGEDEALEVQVVIDQSRSMAARDVMPSRIERTRLELNDLIARMQGIRLGLIVYAARAHVMLPATTDKSVLRHATGLLDTQLLPTEGSNLLGALRVAAQQFTHTAQARAILLLSDGELTQGSQTEITALLDDLRRANIRLYVLGTGTPQGAPLLSDTQGWLQYEGRAVVTRLQRARLQALAEGGNGRYAEISDDDADWQVLYDNGIARLQAASRAQDAGDNIIWRDLSAWCVLPALVLLLLAHVSRPSAVRVASPLSALVVAVGISGVPAAPVQAAEYADAYDLYTQGEFTAAARAFAQLKGFEARLAEGISHYQAQAWASAAAGFIQATLEADTHAQRARALFNLGNTYFKQADYHTAVKIYTDALRYAPQWRAAQINLDYARALQQQALEELPVATREGKGARSARVADNVAITQGRLSIDGSEGDTQNALPLPDAAAEPGAAGDRLQQAAPAASQVQRDEDVRWTYDITSPEALAAQHTQFEVDEKVIWQRLYESEEGFAAPQETPHALPGVTPW